MRENKRPACFQGWGWESSLCCCHTQRPAPLHAHIRAHMHTHSPCRVTFLSPTLRIISLVSCPPLCHVHSKLSCCESGEHMLFPQCRFAFLSLILGNDVNLGLRVSLCPHRCPLGWVCMQPHGWGCPLRARGAGSAATTATISLPVPAPGIIAADLA